MTLLKICCAVLMLLIANICKAQKLNVPIILIKGNAEEGPIIISYKNDFGDVVQIRFKDEIREIDKNVIKLPVNHPLLLELITTTAPSLVYAEPGDTITISSKEAGKSYSFKANGCAQSRVDFFSSLEELGYGMGFPEYFKHIITDSTYVNDVDYVSRIYDERNKILRNYASKNCKDENFVSFVRDMIKTYYVKNLLFPYSPSIARPVYQRFPTNHLSLIYHSPLYELLNQPKLMPFAPYNGMLINYVNFVSKVSGNNPEESSVFYKYAVDSLRGKERDYVLLFLMKKVLRSGSGEFELLYKNFQRDCATREYRAYVDSVAGMNSGIMASAILATPLESDIGEKTTWGQVMRESKGDLLYIDFWASWCAPCLEQIPYSKKMEAVLNKKPVTFIYLSVDTDKAKWLKSIKGHALSGVKVRHYLVSGKSSLANYLKVPPIPRYLLFDKEGRPLLLNAPRPQDPKTLQRLQNELLW